MIEAIRPLHFVCEEKVFNEFQSTYIVRLYALCFYLTGKVSKMLAFPFFVSAESRFSRGYHFKERMRCFGSIIIFRINDLFRKYRTLNLLFAL